MSNRTSGILLILLSIISLCVLVFLFPCDSPSCTEPACKDITGAIFLLIFGVPMVIDSLIHKNKQRRKEDAAVCISKTTDA